MWEPRLLERNPLTGVEKIMHWDETLDRPYYELRGDAQSGLDHASTLRNIDGYQDPKKDMVHVAHVTPMLEYKLLCEQGIDISNPDHLPWAMAKIERDPDYAKARVGAGRMMGKEHLPKQHFLPKRRFERRYGCELTKILDGCH